MFLPADAKPFADVRQLRHEKARGRTALHGRTARKLCRCSFCFHTYADSLSRSREARCSQHDYLDADNAYDMPPTPRLVEPYVVTAFEMNGLDVNHSFQKARAWEAVPTILAENSVGLPSIRKLMNGREERQYCLRPEGMIMPDPAVAAAEAMLNTHLYEIRRHRPRLKAVFPDNPPEGVTKPLLKATLKCAGTYVPQSAVVRVSTPSAFFDVTRAKGKPLEIDLGQSCLISAFSTQGRHPSTRLYPRAGFETIRGERTYVVEDRDYLPNYRHGERYKGPYWTVRTTEGDDGVRGHAPAWVSRYELLWRSEGGRQWNALGTFAGNTDEWSEVAHNFSEMRGGVVARYLRIVPLECEGGGAMRVGVYGECLRDGSDFTSLTRKLDSRSMINSCEQDRVSLTGQKTELVRYTVTARCAMAGPRTHICDGRGLGGYKDDYFLTDRRATKRHLREHVAEMLQEWHDREDIDSKDAITITEDAYRYDEVDQLLRHYSDAHDGDAPDRNQEFASDDFGDDAAVERVMAVSAIKVAKEQEELKLAMTLSDSLVSQGIVQDEDDAYSQSRWDDCGSSVGSEEWEVV